jgi:hypothetical protein
MKRWAPLLLGAGGLAILAYLLSVDHKPRKPEVNAQAHNTPLDASPKQSSPDPQPGSSSLPRSLLDRANEILASRNVEKLQDFASELRHEARTNSDFLKTLGEIVLNPSQPMDLGELAAVVLGSLQGTEAQHYLSSALAKSVDAGWSRTLILALGSFKDWTGDEEVFGPALGAWGVKTRLGLVISVEASLPDLAIRSQVLSYLAVASIEVRDAAVRALFHSTQFSEVRRDFLSSLRSEGNQDLKGEIGKGLAEWARTEKAESPERQAITGAILEQGARREAAAVRFGAENALKVMALTTSEVASLAASLRGPDFDQRRWAFAILTEQASRPGLPGREELFDNFEQILGKDASPKGREYAAAAIASFPDYVRSGPVLVGALSDPAWHVRARAAEALGKISKDETVMAALRRVIAQDDNPSVRQTAQRSLDRLSR